MLFNGAGGQGAGGGADEEPLGGSGEALEGAATFGDADGSVAFAGQGGCLCFFVGQVGLGGGQFGLAGFAVQGEVVERL